LRAKKIYEELRSNWIAGIAEPTETRSSYVKLNHDPSIPVDYSPLAVIGMGYLNATEKAQSLRHLRSNHNENDDGGPFEAIPTEICNDPTSYDGAVSGEAEICAGTMEGSRDTCIGDSGGPLLYYHHDDTTELQTPLQVGLVSWGMTCGLPRLPTVYARVSSGYEWILEVVCGDWRRTIAAAENSIDDADPGAASNTSDDDWFLCKDYDDGRLRNRTGGIFSVDANTNASVGELLGHDATALCNETTEVSFEFRLTADAYGWEVSWELLSNSTQNHAAKEAIDDDATATAATVATRVTGDQLFNDHETRLYRLCLPRLSGESGNCYALNIRDKMRDGLGHPTKTQPLGPNATLNNETTPAERVDSAGFWIRFGNAQVYQDFGFPDYGEMATFSLCPGEEDGNTDDTIRVIRGASTEEPTTGLSDQPSVSPTA